MSNDIQNLKDKIQPMLDKYEADFAYGYGSFFSGNADETSDIDIAVSLPSSVQSITVLIEDLADTLNVPIEKLDIKRFEDLPLALRFRVVSRGKLLYVHNLRAQRVSAVKTLTEYADAQPFFQMATRAFLKRHATV